MKGLLLVFCLFMPFSAAGQTPAQPGYVQPLRPYRPGQGGVSGKAYYVPSAAPARAPARATVQKEQVPAKQPLPYEKLKDAEPSLENGDTAFFKKYIQDNPEVIPDVKLKGKAEW